jgi:hypothetical protein
MALKPPSRAASISTTRLSALPAITTLDTQVSRPNKGRGTFCNSRTQRPAWPACSPKRAANARSEKNAGFRKMCQKIPALTRAIASHFKASS